mgnify:CR=1 FL=1
MYDLICVGSISLDLYFSGKSLTSDEERFRLAIGGKYLSDFFHLDIGGGGVNVAVGVAKHGYKTAVFGKLGDNEFKNILLRKLKEKNVSSEFIQLEKDYYKISSILLKENGERTIIHYETPTHLAKEFFLYKDLKKAKNIYFSPLADLSIEEKTKMIDYLKGDQTLTFVNLSIKDCQQPIEKLEKIFQALDILILNAHEYATLVKKNYHEIDFYHLKLESEILNDRVVIITDGEKGSYGYFQGKFYYQKAITPKKILDTTGAGDGYTAGFIAQYLQNGDIPSSMKNGAIYAAKILGKIGGN